jgi:hypothetical protein
MGAIESVDPVNILRAVISTENRWAPLKLALAEPFEAEERTEPPGQRQLSGIVSILSVGMFRLRRDLDATVAASAVDRLPGIQARPGQPHSPYAAFWQPLSLLMFWCLGNGWVSQTFQDHLVAKEIP